MNVDQETDCQLDLRYIHIYLRFLVYPVKDGVEDGVLKVADHVGADPLGEHLHGTLQQVLPLEGVCGRRSLCPRLCEESQILTFHFVRTCFSRSSSTSRWSGRSLMMSLEVWRETSQTSFSRDSRQRDSRLETLLCLMSGFVDWLHTADCPATGPAGQLSRAAGGQLEVNITMTMLANI